MNQNQFTPQTSELLRDVKMELEKRNSIQLENLAGEELHEDANPPGVLFSSDKRVVCEKPSGGAATSKVEGERSIHNLRKTMAFKVVEQPEDDLATIKK